MSFDSVKHKKNMTKNTIIMYCRMIFVMMITLYTSRIILSGLGVVDYGIYNIVGGLATFFSFINFAMLASTQRFLNYEIGNNNCEKLKITFKTSLCVHFAMAIIVFLMAEPLGIFLLKYKLQIPDGKDVDALIVFQCSIVSIFIQIIYLPYNAIIIAREKVSIYALITIIQSILNLLCAFIITKCNSAKLINYAFLMLAIQLTIAAIYIIHSLHSYQETRGRWIIDKSMFKEMMSFTGWNIFGGLSWMLCTQGLNILLGMFFLPAINAARGIAVQIQSAVTQIYNNLNTVVSPQLIQSFSKGEWNIFFPLFYRSSKYFVFLLTIVGVPIFIKISAILNIWLIDVPDYTSLFIKILLCISLLDALGVPIKVGVDACGKVRNYHLIIGIIQISVIAFSYIILKHGGDPSSPLFVYLIISVISLSIRLWLFKRLIPKFSLIIYLKDVILRLVIILIFSYYMGISISPYFSNTVSGICLFSGITIVGIIFLIIIIGISNIEKKELLLLLTSILNKNYRNK